MPDLAKRIGRTGAATALIAMLVIAGAAHAAEVRRMPFGKTRDGVAIVKTVLRNDLGMSVAAIDFGATLTAIETPDREGKFVNVVLNRTDIGAYETNQRRYGAVIGRYAGRITDARFTLDGETHALEAGRNNMTLHGGSHGYDKRALSSAPISDRQSVGVRYLLLSPAGDQGFPGALRLTVTYRLMRKSNELRIEYLAETTAPTVINLTITPSSTWPEPGRELSRIIASRSTPTATPRSTRARRRLASCRQWRARCWTFAHPSGWATSCGWTIPCWPRRTV
ncbi:hypothetical protein CSW62_06385 [Caulobacter sp. FWC2]|nr:hypothetical protein CSW62_06385 [Caulobacter sp. FWC2]